MSCARRRTTAAAVATTWRAARAFPSAPHAIDLVAQFAKLALLLPPFAQLALERFDLVPHVLEILPQVAAAIVRKLVGATVLATQRFELAPQAANLLSRVITRPGSFSL